MLAFLVLSLSLSPRLLAANPTACCYCTTKTVDKILLSPYTSDCEEKSGQFPFDNCTKIQVLEGNCALIELKTVKGARKCFETPVTYLDKNSKKIQLRAPREALLDCKALSLPDTKGTAKAEAKNDDTEYDPCQEYLDTLCSGIEPGENRLLRCLKEHKHELSAKCRSDRGID